MKKQQKNIARIIYSKLKFIWVLSSILILVMLLLLNYSFSTSRSYQELHEISSDLSNNVDGFIEDLFQDVYTLPVYGKELSDCKQNLYPFMQHIVVNNPMISGLIISDIDHNLVCSTLPENASLISGSLRARTIKGPIHIPLFDKPVYLVQQKIGHYHIGIVIVSPVLEHALQTSHQITNSVALHNQIEKNNIIRIERSDNHSGWVLSDNIPYLTPANAQSLYAWHKLQTIDGDVVVVFENHKTQLFYLWLSQLLIIILFSLCSYLLFLLIKRLLTKRYSLHTAMKLAIKNKEFYPLYQPVYDVQQRCFKGVEVLLRWQDNQDEIIMPDFFIGEAETSGLIVPITLQIIEIAFSELQATLREHPDFHLAINLSAHHFKDPDFFIEYNKLVEQYHIIPKQVLFEITERDLLDKNDHIFKNTMLELRKAGYSLAVDDYGTGHASISYLQNFPFSHLKIDKFFIQAIGSKAITESLNEAIIQMAKQLKLQVIAEGVETEEQVHYLSQNEVRYLQGWYYAKALTIDKLTQLLQGEQP